MLLSAPVCTPALDVSLSVFDPEGDNITYSIVGHRESTGFVTSTPLSPPGNVFPYNQYRDGTGEQRACPYRGENCCFCSSGFADPAGSGSDNTITNTFKITVGAPVVTNTAPRFTAPVAMLGFPHSV